MTGGQKDLIHYRISRAKETLQEARLMFESNLLHGAANRLYYACFYSVLAILLSRNLSSNKHSGVAALFNMHFVKTGIISKKLGRFYSDIFDNRLESDYGELVEISKEELQQNIITAKEFIDRITELITG